MLLSRSPCIAFFLVVCLALSLTCSIVASLVAGGASAMPHVRSFQAALARRQRAIAKGFVVEKPRDHSHVLVPNEIAPSVRVMSRALSTHCALDQLAGKQHHYLSHAALATRSSLGEERYRQVLHLNKVAGRAKHHISANRQGASPSWADVVDSEPPAAACGARSSKSCETDRTRGVAIHTEAPESWEDIVVDPLYVEDPWAVVHEPTEPAKEGCFDDLWSGYKASSYVAAPLRAAASEFIPTSCGLHDSKMNALEGLVAAQNNTIAILSALLGSSLPSRLEAIDAQLSYLSACVEGRGGGLSSCDKVDHDTCSYGVDMGTYVSNMMMEGVTLSSPAATPTQADIDLLEEELFNGRVDMGTYVSNHIWDGVMAPAHIDDEDKDSYSDDFPSDSGTSGSARENNMTDAEFAKYLHNSSQYLGVSSDGLIDSPGDLDFDYDIDDIDFDDRADSQDIADYEARHGPINWQS